MCPFWEARILPQNIWCDMSRTIPSVTCHAFGSIPALGSIQKQVRSFGDRPVPAHRDAGDGDCRTAVAAAHH